MKLTYSVNPNMTFEIEGTTHRELWEQLAEIDELYKDLTCRKFGSTSDNVKFVVRENEDGDKFYELHGLVRGEDKKIKLAKKSFGCHKKGGGLFPQRKDKEGNYLPDNGWLVWDGEKNV